MPCYSPLKGYKSRVVNESGKRSIVFNRKDGFSDMPVDVPCGQCIGCRLERSRQWALRCVHEASLYENNCFITLTYNDENLPHDLSLNKKHFQDFMKRLRKRYVISPDSKIRYFHCGEYGEKNFRPHYHACLFNFDFRDKELWSVRDGVRLYTSRDLAGIWKYGFSTVGEVTFESAAYVARYVLKKVTGDRAEEHYRICDSETGELHNVIPEYTTMSRRPGIGRGWYDKYESDVFPSDFIVIRNKKMQPPKYYDGLYTNIDDIKKARRSNANKHKENNTAERLRVREDVKLATLKFLKRSLEE